MDEKLYDPLITYYYEFTVVYQTGGATKTIKRYFMETIVSNVLVSLPFDIQIDSRFINVAVTVDEKNIEIGV
jgi:hypothetical protein